MNAVLKTLASWINPVFDALTLNARDVSGHDYAKIRRKIMVFSSVVVLTPLAVFLAVDSQRLKEDFSLQAQAPVRFLHAKRAGEVSRLLRRNTESLGLLLALHDPGAALPPEALGRMYRALNAEAGAVVDIGLVDRRGNQTAYHGPFGLSGADYSGEDWFHQALARGRCTSPVLLGLRRIPHLVTAVRGLAPDGTPWVLRATVDAAALDALMVPAEPEADAFLADRQGVLQTDSTLFGPKLKALPFPLPAPAPGAALAAVDLPDGRRYTVATAAIPDTAFVLATLTPHRSPLAEAQAVNPGSLALFLGAAVVLLLAVRRLSGRVVENIREAHEARDKAIGERHFKRLSFVRTLATGIGHEINNPLAIINENVGLIKDVVLLSPDVPEEVKGRLTRLAANLGAALDRCRSITHYLIGYQNLFDEKLGFHDLNEVVRLASGVVSQEALDKNVTIRLDLDRKLPSVATYSRQLQEVAVNVLSNAVAASSPGQAVEVFTAQRGAGSVVILVRDSGKGMNEETLRHIFDPFFTTQKSGSTGLGMYITSSIIQRLDGDIHIESRLGQGTDVEVVLPVRSVSLIEDELRPKDAGA